MEPITSFSGQYRFLSNFYPSPVSRYGHTFPTIEHAFQASKTLIASQRVAIASAKTPGDAKRLGRLCAMRHDWEAIKIEVMRTILTLKFRDPALRASLLETGDAALVEGNTWGDRFWGQCPVGVGQNWLGRLLMQVRQEARQETSR